MITTFYNQKNIKLLLFVLFLTQFISCKSNRSILAIAEQSKDNCFQVNEDGKVIHNMNDVLEDTFLTNRFSENSLVIAHAYGIVEDIRAYKEIEQKIELSGINNELLLQKVYYENRIDKRLDFADYDIQDITNRINCETLRLFRIHSDLVDRDNKRQSKYTNAAIIVGTVSTLVIAGVLFSKNETLNDSDFKDWVGVLGGVAAAYLAVKSAKTKQKVLLNHELNMIKSIWDKSNDQGLFSNAVWYLLNSQYFLDPEERESTMIINLITNQWKLKKQELHLEGDVSTIGILLEKEGLYDAEMIQVRISLLSEIENGIDKLHSSLFKLTQEVN
ncbi:hypothetical protein [Flammeovirga kamogawensis]|uniref:Lipoprotein n=1 Tax=Flammeovirga kamogawensis TaxID=373891 RepID=A0ABX8H5C7_9BACT|nr:hypothetical protein [Flammeovirga kamogawensis]MBB6461833.1 hypothetical protein [Flammeovirga kamogawensis]QWG10552.1 hypothetical protein KM029_24505 [Flammeovirga kamogawensis]TRX63660.1 hypothetical protein EO216_24900 [Flammeovirga kamogawensis]